MAPKDVCILLSGTYEYEGHMAEGNLVAAGVKVASQLT